MTEIAEKTIDVQPNPVAFKENISNLPKGKIVDINPDTYLKASNDFVNMANGIITEKDFIKNHPELEKPVGLYKTIINEPLHGGSTLIGNVTGIEATGYVQISAIENLAEDIAEAKYPIIDHEKSKLMANAFSNTKTIEERHNAISKYSQLDQAFKYADAVEIITNKDASGYVKDQIAKGEVPQITKQLQDAADLKAHISIYEQLHSLSR